MTSAQLAAVGYIAMTEKDLRLYQRAPPKTRRTSPLPSSFLKTPKARPAHALETTSTTPPRQLRPRQKRTAEHTPPSSRPGKRVRATSPALQERKCIS